MPKCALSQSGQGNFQAAYKCSCLHSSKASDMLTCQDPGRTQ